MKISGTQHFYHTALANKFDFYVKVKDNANIFSLHSFERRLQIPNKTLPKSNILPPLEKDHLLFFIVLFAMDVSLSHIADQSYFYLHMKFYCIFYDSLLFLNIRFGKFTHFIVIIVHCYQSIPLYEHIPIYSFYH